MGFVIEADGTVEDEEEEFESGKDSDKQADGEGMAPVTFLYRQRLLKKMCQETWPDRPNVHYGEPFVFYELQVEPSTRYDLSLLEDR